jgi:hypothetical protein
MLNATNLLPAFPALVVYGVLIAFAAGIIRGFTGFGSSAFTIAGLSLLFSPTHIVPACMLLEVLASLSLMRSVWQDISWSWLNPLIIGNLIAVPLGVWSLTRLPSTPIQALVSTVILFSSALVLSGKCPLWSDTAQLRVATGLISGFLSGLSAIGGMVVASILFTTPLSAKVARATLIANFFMSYVYALLWAQGQGLMSTTTLQWFVCLVAPMLLGIAVGQRNFLHISEAQFRRLVLKLLMVLAVLGLGRALFKEH